MPRPRPPMYTTQGDGGSTYYLPLGARLQEYVFLFMNGDKVTVKRKIYYQYNAT